MADIDDWLTSAAGRIPAHVPITTLSALEQRLDGQPSPMAASSRRDTGLSMLCACLAAVVGFSAISGVAGWRDDRAQATWIAALASLTVQPVDRALR
jgi:Tfp pilus assembly protein PilN